jgi:hypothetical protein
LGKARERIAGTRDQPRHAVQHSRKPLLVRAESDEHRAVVLDVSIGHVAAKDVAEFILIRASDMRVRRLVLKLRAVPLGASHDSLLLLVWQSFPLSRLMLPLLQQKN